MSDSSKWEFKYSVPRPPEGEVVVLTAEQMEQRLLDQLAAAKDDPIQPMWMLAQFYKQAGQIEKANEQFGRLLERVDNLEAKADIIFSLGQTAEKAGDFELAVNFYQQAKGMEPCSQFTWYFIHNNLGYSLIQLGRYAEAEPCCRIAIATWDERHNAFKNLGLALQGVGRYQEAARAYVGAVQRNAADPRALGHLESLVKEHAELEIDLRVDLECCRRAVAVAQDEVVKAQQQFRPKK